MTIKYNLQGAERKKLVQAISRITGADIKYLGAPTFSYEVDYFTIDRNGNVTFDNRTDREQMEWLMEQLDKEGFTADTAESGSDVQNRNVSLSIELPFERSSFENLKRLLKAKESLIKKALGISALPVEMNEGTVRFPWFENSELEPDTIKAYTHFISALCAMAQKQSRVTVKEKNIDNEKYAFRCFLLRLGFIGAEYKNERKILLRNLTGSSAFKKSTKSAQNCEVAAL